MTATCKLCGAAIRWEKTVAGKPIPLDRHPSTDGNVVLIHVHGDPLDDRRATVLAPGQLPLLDTPHAPRYMPHFATCPNAAEARKPR